MKSIYLALIVVLISGCAAVKWDEKSETEKQAWIIGGAVVLAAVALSKQEDNITIGTTVPQDICFESTCER